MRSSGTARWCLAAERLLAAARWAGRAALDVLLPPQCLTCDAPVQAAGQFCLTCFRTVGFLTEPCCDRCGIGFGAKGQGGVSRTCSRCRAHPPPWGSARAALRYDEVSKRILLPLKHADRIENARALAPHMARAGAALLREADWLVPVPLHRSRLLARRYNQAALLAQAVARLSGRPALLDGLRRIRATRKLQSGGGDQRRAELAGAFAVRATRAEALRDSRVLLIDDVLTTGATVEACTLVLLAAGVARVDVLAAARASDPRYV